MQNLVEYCEYFKDNGSMEVKRAYEPDETVFIWHKHILEIYLRLHGFSFENSLDKYVISNTKYILQFYHRVILCITQLIRKQIKRQTFHKHLNLIH
ncbi:hypothetical protein [Lysinibacillus capsici]|uniref:hypothetical protein n=1 Tax=Lysinibacillus capsici TaxID=2115968 RepID=UPI002E1AA9AF|nr:hypothetical protein [Lysinibacillus capsici]